MNLIGTTFPSIAKLMWASWGGKANVGLKFAEPARDPCRERLR